MSANGSQVATVNGRLIGLAADFLSLTDTPVSYAGEALKGARVNVPENAIEFSPMASERTYPTFVTSALYNAVKNDNWEDLDCGVGQAWVYIKCEVAVPGVASAIRFRPNGETAVQNTNSLPHGEFNVGRQQCYILCCTDSAGFVEWRCNAGALAITLTLVCYWANPPIPNAIIFTGLTTAAWQTLNVGVPHALCMLRIVATALPGGFCNYLNRMVGDTEDSQYGVEWAQEAGVGSAAYVLMASDGDGNIEWNYQPVNQEVTIALYSYLLGCEFNNLMLYSGPYPTVYQDLATPFGKAVLLVKEKHTVGAGFPSTRFRQSGDTLDAEPSNDNCLCTMGPALNNLAYHFVILDSYGICEWGGTPPWECELTAKLLSR